MYHDTDVESNGAGWGGSRVIERAYRDAFNGELVPTEVVSQVLPLRLSYAGLLDLFQNGNYRNLPNPNTKVGIFTPFITLAPNVEDAEPYLNRMQQIGSVAVRMDAPNHPPLPATGNEVIANWAAHVRAAKSKNLKISLPVIHKVGDYDDPCALTNYRFVNPVPSPLPEICNPTTMGAALRFSKHNPAKLAAHVSRFLSIERVDYIEIGNELNIAELNADLDPDVVPGQADADRIVGAYYELLKALRSALPAGHPPIIFAGHAGCESHAIWEEAEYGNGPSQVRKGCLSYKLIAEAVERLSTSSCPGCANDFWSMLDGVNVHAYIRTTGSDASEYATNPTPALYRTMRDQMQGQANVFLKHAANISALSRNLPVYVTELGVEMLPTAPGLSSTMLRYVLGGLSQLGRKPVVINGHLRFDPSEPIIPVPIILYYSTEQVAWKPSANPGWLKYMLRKNGIWHPAKALIHDFNNP